MKTFAIICALAIAVPGLAEAKNGGGYRGGYKGGGYYGGGYKGGYRGGYSGGYRGGYYGGYRGGYYGGYSRAYYPRVYSSYRSCYPSYGYAGYYPYYGGYGGYYGGGYYGGIPSVSFVYSSTPRVYSSRSYYDSSAASLEVDVQRALRRLGYYTGPIDGDIGPGSRAAIRAYQANRGLGVTGRIDSALLRSLRI